MEMIHRELCKKLKLLQMNKRYTHKPESALENEMPQPDMGFWDKKTITYSGPDDQT